MKTLIYLFILLGIITLAVFSFLSGKLDFDMDITIAVYIYGAIAALFILFILFREVG